MPAPVLTTFNTPPIPRIGAYNTILSISTITICICCTSLVVLVIKEAVENLSISALENFITFPYILLLKSLPTPAPIFEAIRPTITVTTAIRSAIPIILSPEFKRYDF